jgi:UDP-glucose 4-epimerase
MLRPLDAYRNNVVRSHALLEACIAGGVRHFAFASSAAVYGGSKTPRVSEDTRSEPVSPYGATKLMVERMLADCGPRRGLGYVALRCFNVAGADPNGRAGPTEHSPPQLIRAACRSALGLQPSLKVFGRDHPTSDGTCVRDYVHVSDVAEAFLAAIRHLRKGGESTILNCGSGEGRSVLEVVEAIERLSGRRVPRVDAPPRSFDQAIVVAAVELIASVLNWRPRRSGLDAIVKSALDWERSLASRRQ